ncbi:MAG: Heat-inducible transcription repressor HrcA [uncultured Thermomicrobiales bacterium]|uniref:Heat-inducible transcription repressor HrcA n=1 Tax=uncultured Thermomicrobiales bacterium TaxID=1645740 RepID=A0A6J4VR64_9BACT|nr:MAG: Heat-inducible transcription repressor HrcA [uncultured Thermomicrobiales bacterium]
MDAARELDTATEPSAGHERPLSDRQRAILRLLVQEYVATGKPVGSKALGERYRMAMSPATIRHEMAELEAAGFLQSPHTSGGRVPTDRGYRYFVHHLMGEVELPSSDQIMIRHQFRQVEVRLDQWMELAAATLAGAAGNVSVVTAPRLPTARLRHVELIALQPRLGLLILVTAEGSVRQVMCHWPEATEQETLSPLADALVHDLRGLAADEVAGRAEGAHGLARFVLEQIGLALRGLDAAERTEVRHSGLELMLAQPEFAGAAGEAQALMALLRGGAFLNAVLPSLGLDGGRGVQVFIGDENPAGELRRFGVVVSTYGVDGEVTGVLGVVGPTRMAYGRSISSVRYMARLMSDLMSDLYSA